MMIDSDVVVISGGVGAARLLRGMHRRVDPLTAVVNVADDLNLHGLHISPDIDTILYTLAGVVSPERGWGLDGETWHAMEMLGRYGGQDWFSLGDRDLGTHLYRTQRLSEGATISMVTDELRRAWELELRLLPATDDRQRTMVTLDNAEEREISFQDYFVARQHGVPVRSVRFEGAAEALPAPGVIEAMGAARRIVIAPSNPIVSIDPILAVPGIRELLTERRNDVIAVSPIIGGEALKGPAARLLTELGVEASPVGVAGYYADVCSKVVIDTVDRALASAVESTGVRCVVADTIMSQPGVLGSLCDSLLDEN